MKSKKLNNKGFTLMEIIVTLLISSLVMMIAGSLILNSLGYFNKAATTDADKQSLDLLADFVRDQLLYASDVKVLKSNEERPEGNDWKWLYVKDGRLMLGHVDATDSEAYNDDFYNRRILEISAKGFNENRLDLKFIYYKNNDSEKKEVYKTSTTLELLNMEHNKNANPLQAETKNLTDHIIYYRNGEFENKESSGGGEEEPDDTDYDGTVGGEIACKNDSNTDTWSKGKNFKKVTFVEFPQGSGSWYRAIVDINNSQSDPNHNDDGAWKSIIYASIPSVWQTFSAYEKGDVVKYPANGGYYYIKIRDYSPTEKGTPYAPTGGPNDNATWKYIKYEDIPRKTCKIEEDTPTDNSSKTVAGEYERCSSKLLEWEGGQWIYPGEYVYYEGQIYRFIYHVELNWGHLQKDPPGSNANSRNYWKKISEDFDEYSSYFEGDIVKDVDGNYYRVNIAWVSTGEHPKDMVAKGQAGWELIDINNDTISAPACRTTWW